jgi:lysozyme family protein
MNHSAKFIEFINRILGSEGGYVNNPEDPGGETNWGISKRSYPNVDIKNLTKDQAIEIYWQDFWSPIHAGNTIFPDAVDYQLLDSAVNSGIQQSIRFLQRAIDVADDGHFGPHSRQALAGADLHDTLFLFLAERLEFMTKLKNWPNASRGWARRIALDMRYAAKDS